MGILPYLPSCPILIAITAQKKLRPAIFVTAHKLCERLQRPGRREEGEYCVIIIRC